MNREIEQLGTHKSEDVNPGSAVKSGVTSAVETVWKLLKSQKQDYNIIQQY